MLMDIKIELKILSVLDAIQGELVDIKSGQKLTNQRLDRLEERMNSMEERICGVDAKMDGMQEQLSHLDSVLIGVIHHQNEDFALLKTVNNKVDNLAGISQAHEEKLRLL